jgi:pimeloyl-ACP methyl ester carboxylesterase
LETVGDIHIRRHGAEGPVVIVLHGGPGAPGSAVELALNLSDVFSVVEPWQRKSEKEGFTETWNDMLRCQEDGLYPSAFSRIISPILMLHGSYDPYPGKMIRDSLKEHIPQLEYREFEKCGHQPSIEAFSREEFFFVIHRWLSEQFRN